MLRNTQLSTQQNHHMWLPAQSSKHLPSQQTPSEFLNTIPRWCISHCATPWSWGLARVQFRVASFSQWKHLRPSAKWRSHLLKEWDIFFPVFLPFSNLFKSFVLRAPWELWAVLRICWAGAVGLLGLKFFTECYQGKYDFTECYREAWADYHLISADILTTRKCFVLL